MSNYELINPDGSSVTPTTPAAVPALPGARVDGLVIREGTMDDLPFIDAQQQAKINKNRLGFLKMKVLIGKVDKKHVLIACDARGERIGYLLAQDQYLKRGDLGMITQMCVIPEYRRSLVAAHLLKAQFDRSAYGCRLYCCWCAQDLRSSNDFWEAMGFVPLAFRTGSEKTTFVDLDGVKRSGGRIHIFWQKRIRPRKADGSPDDTPYWYPSETSGGAIGAARIVLPNPLGTHWSDIKPVVLPAELLTLPPAPEVAEQEKAEQTTEGTKTRRRAVKPCDEPASGTLPRPHPRGGAEQAASGCGGGASGGVKGVGGGGGP
ncbi:MAG: GNAT family N-acetyltransferase, partial [Planctomycetota bacterium]